MSSHRLADMLEAADDFRTRMKEEGIQPPGYVKPACERCGSTEYKMRAYGNKPEQCYCDVCNPSWPKLEPGEPDPRD